MYKSQANAETAKEVLKFFDYAYAKGDLMAKSLDYVPLPDSVVEIIQKSWKENIKAKDGSTIWTK
jgi:phosphate transport system substrate-binding protein